MAPARSNMGAKSSVRPGDAHKLGSEDASLLPLRALEGDEAVDEVPACLRPTTLESGTPHAPNWGSTRAWGLSRASGGPGLSGHARAGRRPRLLLLACGAAKGSRALIAAASNCASRSRVASSTSLSLPGRVEVEILGTASLVSKALAPAAATGHHVSDLSPSSRKADRMSSSSALGSTLPCPARGPVGVPMKCCLASLPAGVPMLKTGTPGPKPARASCSPASGLRSSSASNWNSKGGGGNPLRGEHNRPARRRA